MQKPNFTVASGKQVEPHPQRGLVAFFLIVNFFLLILPDIVPGLRIPGSPWNWAGKIFAITFSCLLLAWSPWLRRNIGLRWRQAQGSIPVSLFCFAVCLGAGIYMGLRESPMAFSRDTLLFQLFMPTLDEELAFRGIALAMQERTYGQSPMSCRLRYGWAAFVLSLVFGLCHALSFEQGHIEFSLLVLVEIFGFASVATIARTRSGSLLWPMLCHSGWNVAFYTLAMMRH